MTEQTDATAWPELSLEGALADLDQRLAAAARGVRAAQRDLKQATEAARVGNVRDLGKAVEALAESTRSLAQQAANVQRSWTFPMGGYLADGGYLREMLAAASASGVDHVREQDGQVFSYPLIVKIDRAGPSLKVGKKTERGLRPSHVAALLKLARNRPAQDNLRPVLHALEKTYLRLTNNALGRAVPLTSVYEMLTLRPGQSRDYTQLDFLLDIYRLDRDGPRVTSQNREFSLPASTFTRGGRGLRFVTESGEEKLYSSIRFDLVPS